MRRFLDKMSGLPALLASMVIWGSIGIFRQYIAMPSGLIAFFRGLLGAVFLLLVMLACKKRPDFSAWRKNLIPLCFSGVFLGANWILLFESYNVRLPGHTGVAVATVCYYMAPVLVTLAAPLLLGERLTLKKGICVAVAFAGIALVTLFSGDPQTAGGSQLPGILLALAAALVYAGIVLLNKRMREISALDRTVAQLVISALVMLPYTLIVEPLATLQVETADVILLCVVCLLHTGVAYALYFGSVGRLSAQTVALCSYVDPVGAILLSVVILSERIGIFETIGVILVIGAALVGELELGRRRK